MNFSDGFNQGMYDGDIDINITNTNTNQNVNDNTNMNYNNVGAPMMGASIMGGVTSPVIETPRERVVYRNIYHTVPHVCPINTRIVNNHIYKHTYQPRYTCCEENTVTNEQCGSCCQFK